MQINQIRENLETTKAMSSKRDVSFKAIRFNVVRGVKRNFCTAMEVRREESNQKCFYVLFTFKWS